MTFIIFSYMILHHLDIFLNNIGLNYRKLLITCINITLENMLGVTNI